MDRIFEDEILNIIEQDHGKIVNFLREMVRVPSISGSRKEKEIQNLIAEKLSSMNMKLDMWEPDPDELKACGRDVPFDLDFKDRPNLVGLSKGTGNGRSLILNGHIDVIPVEPLRKWEKDPWGAEIEDSKMFGRGTADMKSGIAAMVMALHYVIDAGISLRGDVIIESVVDEEKLGNGSLACALRGYQADAGVVTEPTGLRICIAHAGVAGFRLKIEGKAAHPSQTDEGVSAIEKATNLYYSLKGFHTVRERDKDHPLFEKERKIGWISIRRFEGRQDNATLQGIIRYLPNEDPSEIGLKFENYITQVNKSDPWLSTYPAVLEWIPSLQLPPSEVPTGHPMVKGLESAYRYVMKKHAEIGGAPYGCDASFLNHHAKTPTLIFGPGSIVQAHTTNEFVKIDEVITATKVLALFMLDWCGYE